MKFFSQNCSFFLHRLFARVSPLFTRTMILSAALALVLLPASLSASESSAEPSATVKRQTAEAQFTRAEEQRAALTAKPAEKRTLAEYRNVIAGYKKVYWITPHAADVQDSLLAIGELYTEMGDRFGRVYYQSAVEGCFAAHREIAAEQSGRHDCRDENVSGFSEAFSALDTQARSAGIPGRTFASAKQQCAGNAAGRERKGCAAGKTGTGANGKKRNAPG